MNAKVLIQHASLLNSEGVRALAGGNAGAAHQRFKQALEVLSHATEPTLRFPPLKASYPSVVLSCCPVPGFDQSDYYVCNNALLFDVSAQQVLDGDAIAACCHASMFNLALTAHQRGLATGSQRTLASAGRLYDQCLRLSSDFEAPANEVNLFVMASLNNAAQINYSLGDFDLAVERLQSVRELVAETDLTACGLPNVLEVDEVILNVLVTCKPSTAPCA